jgi:hypothetical protein
MFFQSNNVNAFCGDCMNILKRSRMQMIGEPW